MCTAKIQDHYGNKFKCLRPVVKNYQISITYGNGHMRGKTKVFNKNLCEKHAKIERYNLNRKIEKGHGVIIKEQSIN